jgi:xylose isomerase
MIDDGRLDALVEERYSGWSAPLGKDILAGRLTLSELSERTLRHKSNPVPRSGRQEMLENWIQRFLT